MAKRETPNLGSGHDGRRVAAARPAITAFAIATKARAIARAEGR
jgi:hypothetical protein